MAPVDLLSFRNEDSRPLRISIVGAGISGLSAAICLGNAGHNVSVFESSSHLKEIGAGIQVGPSECVNDLNPTQQVDLPFRYGTATNKLGSWPRIEQNWC